MATARGLRLGIASSSTQALVTLNLLKCRLLDEFDAVCMHDDVDAVYFFFQAEDGIRDLTVTGVQTCALPICILARRWRSDTEPSRTRMPCCRSLWRAPARSEERRVGKECRSGGSMSR